MAPKTSPRVLPRTGLAPLLASLSIPGEIQLPAGTILPIGTDEPKYRVTFRSSRALHTPMTELAVGRAYIRGEIDIDGDMAALLDARAQLQDKVPLRQKAQFLWDFVRSATSMNARAIGEHYGRGDDLYLAFVDTRFRFYSQGLFRKEHESIEEASEHKLQTIFAALDLKPGMRLLDIGGGWGGVTQYCGARGIHVTTLTLAEGQARHIQRLIHENNLPAEVLLQDFLTHSPPEPYDHAVMLGVIEHLPDYRRLARTLWANLKPGARLYLDGSAAVEKYAVSSFTRAHIWHGTHTFMTLPDVAAELLYHGFELLEVQRETRDYERTMREWARRLEAAKAALVARWGEETYRVFRVFLWGGAHAFRTNRLQAYHLVAERRAEPGPRPSTVRRVRQLLGNLR